MRVDLVQRSDSWRAWRQGKITGSMIGIIAGQNPWQSPLDLWKRELGITPPIEINADMQRGIDLEDEARAWFEKEVARLFPAECYQHDDYPWAAASLDGFNEDLSAVLEIKCPRIIDDKIPDHYKPQLQWGMYVSGADIAYYVSWCNGEGRIYTLQRDDAYIHNLLQMAMDFRHKLSQLIEPDLLDREKRAIERKDLQDVSNNWEVTRLLQEYEVAKRQEEYYKDLKEEIKTKVVEAVGARESMCGKTKIIKVFTQGRVDYSSIPALKGVDLDMFRKEGSTSWRIN